MTPSKTFSKIAGVPYDPLQNFLQNGHFVPYDPVPYDPRNSDDFWRRLNILKIILIDT